jgi:hypothetical protein
MNDEDEKSGEADESGAVIARMRQDRQRGQRLTPQLRWEALRLRHRALAELEHRKRVRALEEPE